MVEIYLRRDIYRDHLNKSRLSRFIETFKIYQDFWDLSRIFEISWHNRDFFKTFSRLQAQKSRQIEKSRSRNVITLTNSRSRSRQTVEICQKCHVSADLSVSIETNFLKLSRFSWPSRLTFFWCWDGESRSRPRQDKSRPPRLHFLQFLIFIYFILIFHRCNYIFFPECLLFNYGIYLDHRPSDVLSTTTVASAGECYQSCTVKNNCFHFTYNTITFQCIRFNSGLYVNAASTIPNADYVSGIFQCG